MNFKPTGNRILMSAIEDDSKTETGIIIPDNAKNRPFKALVWATGPHVEEVCVGDTVVFGAYTGTGITLEGKEYIIIEEDSILGILKDKEE